ncbi:MAG TPA: prepilin-type N-terminal cleavage/methylation domain-containing protein [Gammaproteobacteria bacterium]|nr:prepilin-type N-terminal cleavage/methylation domain-containing protein [Gammaproteobacteria bacterium]
MKIKQPGFTLIEVMIAMVIIVVLVAIARPIFRNYELKNRRSQAVDWLLQLRLEMERCKSSNVGASVGTYNNCNVSAPPNITPVIQQKYPNIYYNIAVEIPHPVTGTGYQLTATETTGNDSDCQTLTIDNLGNKGYTGTSPNTIRCWSSN